MLRFTQGRTFVSSLFGFTFIATVVTVSASKILPCPARPDKSRSLDSDEQVQSNLPVIVVAGKPKKWIEEKHPATTCRGGTKH